MIVDHISNIEHYVSMHPRFSKAIQFIQSTDFSKLVSGEIKVDGEDIRAIIIEDNLVSEETSTSAFECHNTFIDIQYCIKGTERVGWKSRTTCNKTQSEYNPEKDVLFFSDQPDTFFDLNTDHFAIYFPKDVHAPMIGEGSIKKVVMKVRVL